MVNEDTRSSKYRLVRQSIVAILSRTGKVVGSGFLVSDHEILTCAHVVMSSGLAFGDDVKVRLFDGSELTARIDDNYYKAPEKEDLMLLHLSGKYHANINSLKLGSSQNTEDHNFITYGFPEGHPDGLWGYGVINYSLEKRNLNLIQLTSQEVTNGFSGSPVFDLKTQRVIGIVTERTKIDLEERKIKGNKEYFPSLRLGSTAFATPSSVVYDAFPELIIEATCPYCGLSAFTEANSNYFHGRDKLVEILSAKLKKYPSFLAVTGASGSGKSSIVQAKVLPKLRSGEIIGFHPGTDIVSLRLSEEDTPELSLFSAYARTTKLSGVNKVTDWSELSKSISSNEKRIVIFIDQFEELFGHYSDKSLESSSFLERLSLLLDENPDLTLILTMRTEFDPQLEASTLGKRLTQGNVLVRGIEGEHLHLEDTIIKPAKGVGLEVEEALTTSIIRDLGNTENPLPLLEFTLTELWERDHKKNRLTYDTYELIGGVIGALSQWANRFYEYDFSNESNPKPRNELQKSLIRRILFRLIRFGSGDTPDVRRRVSRSDLESLGKDAINLLAQMADARLLVKDETTVELIHDALIKEWIKQGELGIWLEEKRRFFLWHQRFEEDFNMWKKNKAEKYLLPDNHLGIALGYQETHAENLTKDETQFIAESKRRLSRRRRRLIVGLASGLTLMSITAVLAVWQWTQAESQKNTARSVQLATISETNLETDTTKSLTLALLARFIKPTPESEIALGRAFYSNHERYHLKHLSSVQYGEFRAGYSDNVLTISDDSTARIWDIKNPLKPQCIFQEHTQSIKSGSISLSNSSFLITTGNDSIAEIWNIDSCELVADLKGHEGPINYAQFSPNNSKQVVTAGSDGSVMLWSIDKPNSPIQIFQGHSGEVWKAKFNPSNPNQILSISSDGTIKLWDIRKPNSHITFEGHKGQVTDIIFDPSSSNRVLTVSNDKTARIWKINQPDNSVVLSGHNSATRAGAFNPYDPNQVVTVGEDGAVILWDLKKTDQPVVLRFGISQASFIAFNELHPNRLLVVGSNGSVGRGEIWDTSSRTVQYSLIGHNKMINYGAFKPGTTNQILTVGDDSTARIWDISTKSIFEVPREAGIMVTSSFMADNPNEVVAINKNGEISIWDIQEKELLDLAKLDVQHNSIIGAAFNPKNPNEVITIDFKGKLQLWNWLNPEKPTQIVLNNDKALAVTYSLANPDRVLVVTHHGAVTVHNTTKPLNEPIVLSRLPIRLTHGEFDPQDSNKVITASDDGVIRIWDLENIRKPVLERNIGNEVLWFVGYDPMNPEIFFAGGRNKRLWIWSNTNDQTPLELDSHEGIVLAGAINPHNSNQLISSSRDGSTNIWNLQYPHKPVSLREPQEEIIDILFSPQNSDKMMTLSESGRLRIYAVGGQKLIDEALLTLSRCLTDPEIAEANLENLDEKIFEVMPSEEHKLLRQNEFKPHCSLRDLS